MTGRNVVWVHVTPGGVIARVVLAIVLALALTRLFTTTWSIIGAAVVFAASLLPVPIPNAGEPEDDEVSDDL